MKSTASRDRKAGRRRAPAKRPGGGPLSVTLPGDLRARLAAQAEKRGLKMATAARVFVQERVTELEDEVELSKAEEWQRAQAWATWERIKAGDLREVTLEQIREDTRQALARRSAGRTR